MFVTLVKWYLRLYNVACLLIVGWAFWRCIKHIWALSTSDERLLWIAAGVCFWQCMGYYVGDLIKS